MHRAVLAACLLGWAVAAPLAAQEIGAGPVDAPLNLPDGLGAGTTGPALDATPDLTAEPPACAEPPPWETVWGVVGIRAFFAGPKMAPNGQVYHPHSSLDLDFDFWVWRAQGLYLFADMRFWNEKPENGVTNAKDPQALGFSKRQFDLVGGPAWNYAGPWEARLNAYTFNNLNRGLSLVQPAGLNDGFGFENRYYLTPEYARLGRAGFDVARADFVSVGYFLTKDMVGNDGQTFQPGLLLRASLTHNLGNCPAYAFGDATYLSDRNLHPKLMLFDVGVAARPFVRWPALSAWRNWEGRLGVENTGDFEVRNVRNLWYASVRVIF